MAQKTGIEWTDRSSNPIRAVRKSDGKRGHACVHASPGCINCYSERWNGWRGTGLKFNVKALQDVDIILDDKELARMRRIPGGKVFVCDMTDLFGPFVSDEFIAEVFAAMAANQRATWQVLTKRPARMAAFVKQYYPDPLPNVWYGTSTEDQQRADERIPQLLQVPAVVRFLSCEPLLGPVDLHDWIGWHMSDIPDDLKIHWAIVGGESGPGARPMHPDWARGLRDQCQAAGVAYFMKQWGEYVPYTEHLKAGMMDVQSRRTVVWSDGMNTGTTMLRVGKKAAGRILDGEEWNQFPEAVPA